MLLKGLITFGPRVQSDQLILVLIIKDYFIHLNQKVQNEVILVYFYLGNYSVWVLYLVPKKICLGNKGIWE